MVTVPEDTTCEMYSENIKRGKENSVKISYKLIEATANKEAFMQTTETLRQDKIMAARAHGIQGTVRDI